MIIIVADFTEGQAVFPAIANRLEDLDIGILVNNVGLSYIHPEYFLEVTKEVCNMYYTISSYMQWNLGYLIWIDPMHVGHDCIITDTPFSTNAGIFIEHLHCYANYIIYTEDLKLQIHCGGQ